MVAQENGTHGTTRTKRDEHYVHGNMANNCHFWQYRKRRWRTEEVPNQWPHNQCPPLSISISIDQHCIIRIFHVPPLHGCNFFPVLEILVLFILCFLYVWASARFSFTSLEKFVSSSLKEKNRISSGFSSQHTVHLLKSQFSTLRPNIILPCLSIYHKRTMHCFSFLKETHA